MDRYLILYLSSFLENLNNRILSLSFFFISSLLTITVITRYSHEFALKSKKFKESTFLRRIFQGKFFFPIDMSYCYIFVSIEITIRYLRVHVLLFNVNFSFIYILYKFLLRIDVKHPTQSNCNRSI